MKAIIAQQMGSRIEAYSVRGFKVSQTYNVTTSSGGRLMGIANSNGDYNVYHYIEDGRVGLQINEVNDA